MSKFKVHVEFDVVGDESVLRPMAEESGESYDETIALVPTAMLETLNEELGDAKSWKPFEFSGYRITLENPLVEYTREDRELDEQA